MYGEYGYYLKRELMVEASKTGESLKDYEIHLKNNLGIYMGVLSQAYLGIIYVNGDIEDDDIKKAIRDMGKKGLLTANGFLGENPKDIVIVKLSKRGKLVKMLETGKIKEITARSSNYG